MNYCFHCVGEIENPEERFCPHCGKEHNVYYPPSNELPPGTYLNKGRYFVGKSIGSGGFSITYIGFDCKLHKKVVIKETFYNGLFKRNSNDRTLREPLKVTYDNSISFDRIIEKTVKECTSLSQAENLTNIVKVYDWFDENNTAYIITEYINGVTLYDKIREIGSYSWNELYSHIKPLIYSLAQLHKKDLLHRDIKPQNIMLRKTYNEEFVLIDFGLARSNQTRTLSSMGIAFTLGYSPFEQRSLSKKDGTYTDVYAMAATIYHALAGEEPSMESYDTIDENFPRLKFLRNSDEVPDYVVDTLEYALQPDYRLRCQTLDEFLSCLENNSHSDNTVKRAGRKIKEKSSDGYYRGVTIAVKDEPVTPSNSFARQETNMNSIRSGDFKDGFSGTQSIPDEIHITKRKGTAKLVTVAASMILIVGLIAVMNVTGAVNVPKILAQIHDSDSEFAETESETKFKREIVSTNTDKKEDVSSIQYVNTPSVEGLSLESAQKLLESAGLECDIVEEPNDSTDADHILKQYPEAGTEVESGDTIKLVVTKEKKIETDTQQETQETSSVQSKAEDNRVTVPNVKNLTYEEAAQKLSSLGLAADIKEYQYSDTVEDGYVIFQTPESGKVNKNTKISLVVSKGSDPQLMKVGNYVGQNIYTVQSALESEGMRVLYSFADSGASQGIIISQSISEGQSVQKGSSITFVVAQQSIQYTSLGDFFGGLTCSSEMGGFPAGNILIFDGEAWAPNSSGGVGEYIMFSDPKKHDEVTVSGCIIDIGCLRSNEDFFAYGRPTKIRVEFSDNTIDRKSVV